MNARGALGLSLAASLATSLAAACGGQGPPRPTDVAPFPMPNPPGIGLPNEQSYSLNEAADLVLDEVTGLSWQRSVDAGPGEAGGFVWMDAIDHCETLVQGGHDDFRLPSRLELVTLVDPSRTDPSIDLQAFPGAPSEATWSASPFAADPEQSFYVNFFFGYTSTNFLVYAQSVRCVRNAQRPKLPTSDRFQADRDTVADQMTGLVWEREAIATPMTFAEAATYCSKLSVDGTGGFRAPSMKELQTLVAEARPGVAIDPEAFPGAAPDAYWTSTLVANDPESAWFVRFSDGYCQYAALDTPSLVRCVR